MSCFLFLAFPICLPEAIAHRQHPAECLVQAALNTQAGTPGTALGIFRDEVNNSQQFPIFHHVEYHGCMGKHVVKRVFPYIAS